MAPRWLHGREDELLALVREHGPDIRLLASHMGTTPASLEIAKRRNPDLGAKWKAAATAHGSRAASPDASLRAKTVALPPRARITTLDELLDAAKVEREEWAVERFIVNKWEMGAKHPVTGEILVEALFQVKATLVRPDTAAILAQIRAHVARDVKVDATRRAKLAPVQLPRASFDEPHTLEVVLTDVHIGKLAWAEETGSDYDSRIAERLAREAVRDLVAQAQLYRLDEVVLVFGNDFFHYDTAGGTTTSGTPQDRDTRLHKMFRRGRGFASWAIAEAARVAPKVRVLIVPGNHDELLAFMLGEVLAAEYANDERVSVDNTPRLRKYALYGRNLVGYTHGKDEPHHKLPLIMAHEVPAMWAASVYREVHTGHFHTSKVKDSTPVDSHNGVRIRTLQALSGTDAWHYRKGYIGEPQAAEAFVWRHAGGLRANLFSMPALGRTP